MNNPISLRSAVAITRALAATAVFAIFLPGCAAHLVAPYDDQLVQGTESLFKTASTVVDDGFEASPRTDTERAAIKKPESSAAHFLKFEPRYDEMIRDTDLLILRSMAGSASIDPLGEKLQGKIEAVIESAIPSVCEDLNKTFDELGSTSLTVKNFVDLKCLLTSWKDQHQDTDLTRGTLILKKANWEGRRLSLFRIVLPIERAELSKKP